MALVRARVSGRHSVSAAMGVVEVSSDETK